MLNYFKRHYLLLSKIKNFEKKSLYFIYLKTEFMRILLKPFCLKKLSIYRSMFDVFFLEKWFFNNIIYWLLIISKNNFRNKEINILEIGSYEGASAFFFLNELKNSKISCVDTWSDYHTQGTTTPNIIFTDVEKKFDQNLDKFNDRLKKIKMSSNKFFNSTTLNKGFDLIYVDGSHSYNDVLMDANNSLKYLNKDGILIFDDFFREEVNKAILDFYTNNHKLFKVVFIYHQFVIKKI